MIFMNPAKTKSTLKYTLLIRALGGISFATTLPRHRLIVKSYSVASKLPGSKFSLMRNPPAPLLSSTNWVFELDLFEQFSTNRARCNRIF
jgi:hypothetical protein